MTKLEAIRAMEQGKKVYHDWFGIGEWMTIKNGRIVFEDGHSCPIPHFFLTRHIKQWEDGYYLFDDNQSKLNNQ